MNPIQLVPLHGHTQAYLIFQKNFPMASNSSIQSKILRHLLDSSREAAARTIFVIALFLCSYLNSLIDVHAIVGRRMNSGFLTSIPYLYCTNWSYYFLKVLLSTCWLNYGNDSKAMNPYYLTAQKESFMMISELFVL